MVKRYPFIKIISILCLQAIASAVFGQEVIDLYAHGIPNSKEFPEEETTVKGVARMVSKPTLTMYKPHTNANGTAVIICPGGGYGVLVMDREGERIAKAFNEIGITAFVLKYRLPNLKWMVDPSLGPLQDAQQALLLVRENAKRWNLDSNSVGIMGFSAGGHLAATAGTHFEKSYIDNSAHINLRPDFMILVYPVISMMDDIGHVGSRTNLLAVQNDDTTKLLFSNDEWVTSSTPPTFITHASDDVVVPVEHSMRFYNKLVTNGVSAEMHLYAHGGHGYGKEPSLEEWFGRCKLWLNGLRITH